jgi:ABC-type multidrug transport system ATPase subunit
MNKYNFTIFDITPITSFLLSYLRLVFSYTFFSADFFENITEFEIPLFGKIYKPKVYILTSLMVQAINLVFYFLVIILFESSILEECFNCIKVKLMRENNITFSNPQINNDYYSDEVFVRQENEINSNDDINIRGNNQNDKRLNNINQANDSQYNDYVQNEINKINSDQDNKLTTKIIGLKKTYWMCCSKNIRAINNLYLGLENNEKFGLLGFNGSGKTTTFKTITKEILYDSGSIQLFGKDTKSQFEKIRNSIGYCPQENPIFDYMKVREMVSFYLDLKKINESTENICEKFGLSKFLDTYCINLSGGNKRKLSFAIALMCKPKLLLLDEPSSGVDPESRRIMWKNILELNKAGNKFNMILTTHSMEEAEVLCDTVSWLKSGNFISIGNPEKLKISLSAGYKLNIKFAQLNQNCDNNLYNKAFSSLSSMVKGFNISNNNMPDIESIKIYLIELEKVIVSIKDKCSEMKFEKLNKDFSFEFKIKIIKEKQSELFVQVLDMKNTNNLLSEISISMESLENILTRL